MSYKAIRDGAPVEIKQESSQGELIKVENATFDISRQIAQANPMTGAHEQTDNAVQGGFKDGKRVQPTEVIWLPIQWPETGRTSKLSIYDNGIGMNANELLIFTNIASSGKHQAMNENFGRGELISCLGANPLGLIWISCQDGDVNMVKLIGEKKKDGQYNYMREYIYGKNDKCPFNKSDTVIRLFDKKSGQSDPWFEQLEGQYPDLFDTSKSWTIKINLGHKDEQNTCENPYNGFDGQETQAGANWLPKSLFYRYWDINQQFEGSGPRIRFFKGTTTKDSNLTFSSYLKTITAQKRTRPKIAKHQVETVSTSKGDVKVHYIYDAPASYLDKTDVPEDHPDYKKDTTGKHATWSSGMQVDGKGGWCGVIFKGKLYSLRRGNAHHQAMKYFSIPAKQENFKIMVELPDDYPVYSDGDREFIKYEQQSTNPELNWQPVSIIHFGNEVADAMPKWFQDLIDDAGSELEQLEKLQKDINDFYRKLLSSRSDGSAPSSKEKRKPKVNRREKKPVDTNPDPVTRKPKKKKKIGIDDFVDNTLEAPKIIPLTSIEAVKSQELTHFAASYAEEAKGPGFIYINMLYDQFLAYKDNILGSINIDSLDEEKQARITEQFNIDSNSDYIGTICKSIVRGLWHKNKGNWNNENVDNSLKQEALTLMAEQLFDDNRVFNATRSYKKKVEDMKTTSNSKYLPGHKTKIAEAFGIAS